MEDYIKGMNKKLHYGNYIPYEIIKDEHEMLVAKKLPEDSIRLAAEVKGLDAGYVQILGGKVVSYFKMDEIILVES